MVRRGKVSGTTSPYMVHGQKRGANFSLFYRYPSSCSNCQHQYPVATGAFITGIIAASIIRISSGAFQKGKRSADVVSVRSRRRDMVFV